MATKLEKLAEVVGEYSERADLYDRPAVLADIREMLKVLSRVVLGKPVLAAFGAPGDWGYGTPIGDILAMREAAPAEPQPAGEMVSTIRWIPTRDEARLPHYGRQVAIWSWSLGVVQRAWRDGRVVGFWCGGNGIRVAEEFIDAWAPLPIGVLPPPDDGGGA